MAFGEKKKPSKFDPFGSIESIFNPIKGGTGLGDVLTGIKSGGQEIFPSAERTHEGKRKEIAQELVAKHGTPLPFQAQSGQAQSFLGQPYTGRTEPRAQQQVFTPEQLFNPDQLQFFNRLPGDKKLAMYRQANAAAQQQASILARTSTQSSGGTSEQRTLGTPVDKQFIKATRGLNIGEAAAESTAAAAQAKAAEDAEQIMADRLTTFAAERKKAAGEQQVIQNQIAEKEMILAKSKEDFKALDVNPDRWWQNRSTGNQLMAALAIAMGGYAKGLSGGRMENVAMKMIDKAINRDIDQQKMAIAKAGKNIQGDENTLAYFNTKLGNMQAAEAATRDMLNQEVQMKLAQTAQTAKAPEIRANSAKTLIAIQRNQAMLEAQQKAQAVDKVTQSRTSSYSRSVAPMPAMPTMPKNSETLQAPSEKILDRFRKRSKFRQGLFRYWKAFKALDLPIAGSSFWKEKADAVSKQKGRLQLQLLQDLSDTELNPAAAETVANSLGNAWQTNKGVQLRLKDLLAESVIGYNADMNTFKMHFNLASQHGIEQAARVRMFSEFGIQFPGLRKKNQRRK